MTLPRGHERGSRRFRALALVGGVAALLLAAGCRTTRPGERPCEYDPWSCPVPKPGNPRPPAAPPAPVPPAPPPPIPA